VQIVPKIGVAYDVDDKVQPVIFLYMAIAPVTNSGWSTSAIVSLVGMVGAIVILFAVLLYGGYEVFLGWWKEPLSEWWREHRHRRREEQALKEERESDPVEKRLREANAALKQQRTTVTKNVWLNRGLSAAQYVLGTILATAFVQKSVPSTLVGSLGLIVIAAQAIRQRFNPDREINMAKQNIVKLQSLIRNAEDELARVGEPPRKGDLSDAASRIRAARIEVLTKLTQGLNQIDEEAHIRDDGSQRSLK
jgi:hypothetical protein